MARPSKLDNLRVKKLEEAFAIGSTVNEACFYADISKQTYYNWTSQNPELLDRFDRIQQVPILKARITLIRALQSDPYLALKYLERKCKTEFSTRISDIETSFTAEDFLKLFEAPN